MNVTEANDFVLTLSQTREANGEIAFDDIAAIAKAMQDLATRVGRLVADQHGPGRTVDRAARVTRLRLRAIGEGSTVLEVGYGEQDALDLDVGLEKETADRFWNIIEGVQAGQRPDWVTSGIADATLEMVDALSRAAERVSVVRGDQRQAQWHRRTVRRDVWQIDDRVETTESVAVVGRLEAVDLAAKRFRLRDDVGNKITLNDVMDADDVGSLVGRRTTATGIAVRGERNRLMEVRQAVLEPTALAPEWFRRAVTDIDALIASVPGPDPDGGADLTDEEFDSFLAAARGE